MHEKMTQENQALPAAVTAGSTFVWQGFPVLPNYLESMRLNIDRDLVKRLTGQRTASK